MSRGSTLSVNTLSTFSFSVQTRETTKVTSRGEQRATPLPHDKCLQDKGLTRTHSKAMEHALSACPLYSHTMHTLGTQCQLVRRGDNVVARVVKLGGLSTPSPLEFECFEQSQRTEETTGELFLYLSGWPLEIEFFELAKRKEVSIHVSHST